jgi:hypothetical protein
MTMTSDVLEMCARALGTYEPCRTSRSARLFFMLEACDPQGTAGCVIAQSPPRREAGSEATGYVARQSPPSGFGATVHVMAPEPSLSGGRALEPLDTWQHRSPPQLGGRFRYYGIRGGLWLHAPLFVLT